MADVALLPESGITQHYIPPGAGENEDHTAQHYEINGRVNGTRPLPGLLVNRSTMTRIPRQPVSISALVDAQDGNDGTDFVPIILSASVTGDYSDVDTASGGGFVFLCNGFGHTGDDPADGTGIAHLVGWLWETSVRSQATINTTSGSWSETSFMGPQSDGGHVGGMRSAVVITPGHKDGATSGTATEAYGIAIFGGDERGLGASLAYSMFIADGGNAYVSGSIIAGAGLAIPNDEPLLLGEIHMHDDNSGNLVVDHQPGSPNGGNVICKGTYVAFGTFDHRFELDDGDPSGVIIADIGSMWSDKTGGHLYYKASHNGSALGWVLVV